MNRSTFCEIKYINRQFFCKGRVYDWGWFQNTDSLTHTKISARRKWIVTRSVLSELVRHFIENQD